MTEEEIEANAIADEDNRPMTAEELARMQPSSAHGRFAAACI